MAEFCKQCADELGFNPENGIAYDFVGLWDDKKWQGVPKDHGLMVLCESCGVTVVNQAGECIDKGCVVHGEKADDNNR